MTYDRESCFNTRKKRSPNINKIEVIFKFIFQIMYS